MKVAIIDRHGIKDIFFEHQWDVHTEEKLVKYGYQILTLPNSVEPRFVTQEQFDLVDGVFVWDEKAYEYTVENEKARQEYMLNKAKLVELSKDLIQAYAGVDFPDIVEKRTAFLDTLDKVRAYEGKDKRQRIEEEL